MKLDKRIKKVGCFYASDWHLTVMLLPYVSKKIEENNKIYMRFENSIKDKMQILLDKLELKNEEDIRNMNWDENLQEDEFCENEKIYIISGTEEYINEKNNSIENYYKNKGENVKIINCYQVIDENNLSKIINREDYKCILNTSGEFEI